MFGRENVIKTLSDALSAKEKYPWAEIKMSYEFTKELVNLMKEQEQVVRCKDCKHLQYTDGKIAFCHLSDLGHDYDWFCADGERK